MIGVVYIFGKGGFTFIGVFGSRSFVHCDCACIDCFILVTLGSSVVSRISSTLGCTTYE